MNKNDLVRIGKDYFKTVAVGGLKASAVAAYPWMASPPFINALEMFLNWFIGKLADILENQAFFIYTDFRTSSEGRKYVEAKLKGYEAELKGNIDEIKQATEEIKSAFRAFAKFN